MTPQKVLELFEINPIVAAIKSNDGLLRCLQAETQVCFVLYGDVCTIGDIVNQLKAAGKLVIIHLDLIDGLSASDTSVEFISTHTNADGIISTRSPLIRAAKARGLLTIQRFFVLDSIALEKISDQRNQEYSDFYEILPGLMPKIIRQITCNTSKPIIAGGLISEKNDIVNALGAGAVAVSSTNDKTWFL